MFGQNDVPFDLKISCFGANDSAFCDFDSFFLKINELLLNFCKKSAIIKYIHNEGVVSIL